MPCLQNLDLILSYSSLVAPAAVIQQGTFPFLTVVIEKSASPGGLARDFS